MAVMSMHASSCSTASSPVAPWTVRSAFDRSAPSARIGALIAGALVLVGVLADSVPVTTGVVLVALLPAVLVDVIERRLPNRLVGGAALVGVATATAEVLVGDLAVAPVDVLLGVSAMAGPLLLVHLIRPAAMGFGDVKVAIVAGAALGLVSAEAALLALAIGSALASTVGLVRRRRTVAFGPGLLAGAVLAVVFVASPLDPLAVDDGIGGHRATPSVDAISDPGGNRP
jgi:leader peptidase (prepilin peptidase)/N-methyltransferase